MTQYLVAYDVDTTSSEGERRLREMARLCEGHGLRVQYSVFELTLEPHQLHTFLARAAGTMDQRLDSVRVYRISESPVILGRQRRDGSSRGGLVW